MIERILFFAAFGAGLALCLWLAKYRKGEPISNTANRLWFVAFLSILIACGYLVLLDVPFAAEMVSHRSFCGVAILLTTAAALMSALKKLTHSP